MKKRKFLPPPGTRSKGTINGSFAYISLFLGLFYANYFLQYLYVCIKLKTT